MALSSSLFTGTSGLKNMGNALQVTGNNISNINTIGFKKGRTIFADTLYENMATQAGTGQMGRGMALGSVSQHHAQGSFESTGNVTDMSIGGEGFFIMRQSNSKNTFYTRAGDFYFDKDGQLINPQGYVVQGWNLDEATGKDVGAIKDLVLEDFTNPPKKSEKITAIANLNSAAKSKANVLANSWDSGEKTHIASNKYEYSTTVKAYDTLGNSHDISVFYDKKTEREWEYIVTMNPEEDKRNLIQKTDSKGLLARGNIIFSANGVLQDMTMEKFTGRLGNFKTIGRNTSDDIKYQIIDYDAITLDGYKMTFKFDGTLWNFADLDADSDYKDDLPDNYKNAKIVYSDKQNVHLTFSNDITNTIPDLKIKFNKNPVANDTLSFDINNEKDIHYQDLDVIGVYGDNAQKTPVADNYQKITNSPEVMTLDSLGLSIVWNPYAGNSNEGKWYWSNPTAANNADKLIDKMVLTNSSGSSTTTGSSISITKTVTNAEAMDMYSPDVKTLFDNRTGKWVWNMPLKEEDFSSPIYQFAPQNNPTLNIENVGSQGAITSSSSGGAPITIKLAYNATTKKWSSIPTSAGGSGIDTRISIISSESHTTAVKLMLWENIGTNSSSGASTIKYTFGTPLIADGEISFSIKPTPPKEYPSAIIQTSSGTGYNNRLSIDFDGNTKNDIYFDTASLHTAAAATTLNTFNFQIDPDFEPKGYESAVLSGNHEYAAIDLDNSNDDRGEEDVIFSFANNNLPYGKSTKPYKNRTKINFDIKGSTSWNKISKDRINDAGFFSFTTDFVGADFGATETDIMMNVGIKYDGNNFVTDSLATTQYANPSSTIFQDSDGYAAGDLQSVNVSTDGTITGIYSNGQLIPLFRVGLAKFYNNNGLNNKGGNLFTATRESGAAITNKPGENGLGTIAPNSIEMSNVDISEEFVSMITQQRGFEANSKTITTTDEMMQTVIGMKR